jgi:hypothetical protein
LLSGKMKQAVLNWYERSNNREVISDNFSGATELG